MDAIQIEKRLDKLRDEMTRVIALRAVFRLFPFFSHSLSIVNQSVPFLFWSEPERIDRLFSILQIISSSLGAIYHRHTKLDISLIRAAEEGVKALSGNESTQVPGIAARAAITAFIATGAGNVYKRGAVFAINSHRPALEAAIGADSELEKAFSRQIIEDIRLAKVKRNFRQVLALPLWHEPPPEIWLSMLDKLKTDIRSTDPSFSIWSEWIGNLFLKSELAIDFVDSIKYVPLEVREIGAIAVNQYLISLKNHSANQPLNRVRAIFIGYGDAGKTSLIRVLHNEPVPEGKEPMTPGIEIREWRVPGTDIQAHFWDFGGQVMVHATHQLFLRSSCLYVLVISARSEINASEQAEYWLEHVKSFGSNAPVLIVGNRAEQADLNIDMETLSRKYSNIVGYFPVSCTRAQDDYLSHANAFKTAFCENLKKLTTHQMLLTSSQFELLTNLQRLTPKQSFLPKDEFDRLCHNFQISEDKDRVSFLDVLDKLGVIIHFPQLPFADGYVLNPRWLTYGIYKLMYAKQPRLTIENVIKLLSEEKVVDEVGNELSYPAQKCRLIMDAMHEFKLSYPLHHKSDTLIIPALLAPVQPDIKFKKDLALAVEFAFDVFLPRHVLPEIIVNRHQEIFEDKVWQTGVVLQHATMSAQALLIVDYHLRKILIWTSGNEARDYLTVLRDEIYQILKRIEVDFKELIVLPSEALVGDRRDLADRVERAPYRQLLACLVRGHRSLIVDSGNEYDVARVLNMFISPQRQDADIKQIFYGNIGSLINGGVEEMNSKTISITGSNIGGNVVAAESISESFNKIAEAPVRDDIKELLRHLVQEIQNLQHHVPQENKVDVIDLAADADALVVEAAREEPSQPRMKRKLDSIVQTAKAVGEVGKVVVDAAKLLGPMLGIGDQ